MKLPGSAYTKCYQIWIFSALLPDMQALPGNFLPTYSELGIARNHFHFQKIIKTLYFFMEMTGTTNKLKVVPDNSKVTISELWHLNCNTNSWDVTDIPYLSYLALFLLKFAIELPHTYNPILLLLQMFIAVSIAVIYTEMTSADFSAKTTTKSAEGFFLVRDSEQQR